MTRQRRAIERVFQQAGAPLTHTELLAEAQQHVHSLGLSTVYRIVEALLAEGLITSVDLPGKAQRFELAAHGHHHHFQCTACSRLFDVPGCPGNISALAPQGFTLQRHEILLYGLCTDCAA